MKKIFTFVLLAAFALLALASCTPAPSNDDAALIGPGAAEGLQSSSAVTLPLPLVLLIGSIVTAGVTGALVWISGKLGIDLTNRINEIAIPLSGLIVQLLNGAFVYVPSNYDPLLIGFLNWLVLITGAATVYRISTRRSLSN